MAGGAGTRLWPISRNNCPKQFLNLDGEGRTFIRDTYDRFAKFIPKENIIIVSSAKYRDLVKEKIPEIKDENLLLEPYSRNTAPLYSLRDIHYPEKGPRCGNGSNSVGPHHHRRRTNSRKQCRTRSNTPQPTKCS